MDEVLPASQKTLRSDIASQIPCQFNPHLGAEPLVQSRDASARFSKKLMPNPWNQVILVMEMTTVNPIPIPSLATILKQVTRYLTPTRMQRQTVRNRLGAECLQLWKDSPITALVVEQNDKTPEQNSRNLTNLKVRTQRNSEAFFSSVP
jgi:hypothetical protein